MDLPSYVRAVRNRWRAFAATFLVVVGAAALLTITAPKTYESKVQFYVSSTEESNNRPTPRGWNFTQARVRSYTQLMTSSSVLNPAAKRANVGISGADLADHVAVTVPIDTLLMDVVVSASTPDNAYRIASAIAAEFPTTVETIERAGADKQSPVKVSVVQQPNPDGRPVTPVPTRNLLLGAVVGVLLALAVAILRERTSKRPTDG